jgi:aconitase A
VNRNFLKRICNKNKEQFQMKYSPVRSTIINGLLEIDLQNGSITVSGKDILEILQEYENDCVKLTIEKI